MKRRDDLAFRQEMRFRNKLVEYLTDWCMGNSHQVDKQNIFRNNICCLKSVKILQIALAAGDVSAITRDLDEACMRAVAALLQGLPLQSEESDRGDLMEAKSQLFLGYLGYHKDLQTRAAFMEMLTKIQILQQGTEFDTLGDMIGDKGEVFF